MKFLALSLVMTVGMVMLSTPQQSMLQSITNSKAAGTPTMAFVRQFSSSACSSATTCVVTTTAGWNTGDLLTFECATINAVYITGVGLTGYVDANIDNGRDGPVAYAMGGYILSAPASAATVTITFNAANGTADCNIRDYSYSNGTLGLDATGDFNCTGCGTTTAATGMTLSGSKDAVIQWGVGNHAVPNHLTAISGSFTDTSFPNDQTGAGFADIVGVSSFATPNWTVSSSNQAIKAGMAIGFGTTACSPWGIIDFSGGTATNNPSLATLTSSTTGMTGIGQQSAGNWAYWAKTDSNNALTYQTASYHAMTVLERMCNGGVTYTTPGTQLGMQYSSTAGSSHLAEVVFNLPYGFAGGTNKWTTVTASVWFRTTFTTADTLNQDVFTIQQGGSGGTFSNVILDQSGGQLRLSLEGSGSASINITTNTWYKVCLKYVKSGTGALAVYDASGSQIGSTATVTNSNGSPPGVVIGESLGGAVTTGRTNDYGGIKICYSDTAGCPFPLVL